MRAGFCVHKIGAADVVKDFRKGLVPIGRTILILERAPYKRNLGVGHRLQIAINILVSLDVVPVVCGAVGIRARKVKRCSADLGTILEEIVKAGALADILVDRPNSHPGFAEDVQLRRTAARRQEKPQLLQVVSGEARYGNILPHGSAGRSRMGGRGFCKVSPGPVRPEKILIHTSVKTIRIRHPGQGAGSSAPIGSSSRTVRSRFRPKSLFDARGQAIDGLLEIGVRRTGRRRIRIIFACTSVIKEPADGRAQAGRGWMTWKTLVFGAHGLGHGKVQTGWRNRRGVFIAILRTAFLNRSDHGRIPVGAFARGVDVKFARFVVHPESGAGNGGVANRRSGDFSRCVGAGNRSVLQDVEPLYAHWQERNGRVIRVLVS